MCLIGYGWGNVKQDVSFKRQQYQEETCQSMDVKKGMLIIVTISTKRFGQLNFIVKFTFALDQSS